jgi:hypothetical protein
MNYVSIQNKRNAVIKQSQQRQVQERTNPEKQLGPFTLIPMFSHASASTYPAPKMTHKLEVLLFGV